MNSVFLYILLFFIILALEFVYFNLARRFSILDVPNERSSHQVPVIRGGGVIFLFASLFSFALFRESFPWLLGGIIIVALISFLDDIKPTPALLRITAQAIAMMLLFQEITLFQWQWWLIILGMIFFVGVLNAFNFMDGINGITGIHALINLISFGYIHFLISPLNNITLLYATLLATVIFLWFNFRTKAVCFAGDIGSILLAYIQIFFLMELILATQNIIWILMFLVFGVDTVITIIHRLMKGKNIFKAHRSHLYQFLANELNWSHRSVALLYGMVQLLVNVILIISYEKSSMVAPLITTSFITTVYLLSRYRSLKILRNNPSNRKS